MKGKRGPSLLGSGKSHGSKKNKPPHTDSMDYEVTTKLSQKQIEERAMRLARKQVERTGLERRKRTITREINGEIKEVTAEIEVLAEQVVSGEEALRQGDLPFSGATAPKPATGKDHVPGRVGDADAKTALSKVAERVDPEISH